MLDRVPAPPAGLHRHRRGRASGCCPASSTRTRTLGAYEEAEGWAGQDTNELTGPVQAQVRALDAINPADLGFRDAIAGGVLAVNVNPGSGNPIGGQTAAIKCWGRTVEDMVLRAPAGLKSALGENPKRAYGERNETPSTRLGTAAVIRSALVAAANYLAEQESARPRAEMTGRAEAGRGAGRAGPQARVARAGAAPGDPLATALPPRGRHRDRDADRQRSSATTSSSTTAPRRTCSPTIAAAGVPVIIGPLFTAGPRSNCAIGRWPIPACSWRPG